MFVLYRPDGTIATHSMTEEACWVNMFPAIPAPEFKCNEFVDLLKSQGWRCERVIVLTASGWERLVEALREDDLEPSVHDTVWEIINRTKEANNA